MADNTPKTIRITYCSECGMVEDALNLMTFIQSSFEIPVELKEGHNGIFEISMNGKVIYSNNNSGTVVPPEGEVLDIITKHNK
jgi:selT/selW/selH-like putative selenoprotein